MNRDFQCRVLENSPFNFQTGHFISKLALFSYSIQGKTDSRLLSTLISYCKKSRIASKNEFENAYLD